MFSKAPGHAMENEASLLGWSRPYHVLHEKPPHPAFKASWTKLYFWA